MKFKSIKTKILLTTLSIGVIAILITNWQAYRIAENAMVAKSYEQLKTVRDAKAREVRSFIQEMRILVFSHSQDPKVVLAMQEFRKAFRQLQQTLQVNAIPMQGYEQQLQKYYNDEFLPEFTEITGETHTLAEFWPDTTASQYLQYHYIANNPYPTGDKRQLYTIRDPAEYHQVEYHQIHERHHGRLCTLIDTFGYDNLFLIDHQTGNMLYSCRKKVDYATNLLTGAYRNTNLAKLFKSARKMAIGSYVKMVDFELYAPSNNAPAAFIVSPVMNHYKQIGVFIVQLPIHKINKMMTGNYKWEEEGLGKTGETYLIGKDLKMRTDSRFLIENPEEFLELQKKQIDPKQLNLMSIHETSILYQKVQTQSAESVIKGDSGTMIVNNYRGIPVLSSYKPLYIQDEDQLKWALLAEIDEAEVYEAVQQIRSRILFITPFLTLFIIAMALLIARNIILPILSLTKGAEKLKEGDLATRVSISSNDEIGTLASTFNQMASNLQQTEEALRLSNEEMLYDLTLASEVQRSIYSPIAPPTYLPVASRFIPHSKVSGDVYYGHLHQDNTFDFFLGDGTGHGVSAAFLTIMANIALVEKAEEESIVNTIYHLNDMLEKHTPDDKFISGFYFRVNENGLLTYVNAGHPDALVIPAESRDSTRKITHLEPTGKMMGLFPSDLFPYQAKTYQLQSGDLLLVYTDGIPEYSNHDDQIYGMERFIELLEKSKGAPLESIITKLFQDIEQFSDNRPADDDLTIMVFEYHP
ncbi:MAG: SpoIIE family protein phosphatase [SAR324 cluster bacterium]|nr:SpoIIE family protein phosphatase [SAR324 cluster bacterium]